MPDFPPSLSDRLERLAHEIPALISEVSLEGVLQRAADLAAEMIGARYAAVGMLSLDGRNLEKANGFSFDDPSPHALAAAVLFAQRVFFQRDTWHRIVLNGMAVDNSWDRSAAAYGEVYRAARQVRGLPW